MRTTTRISIWIVRVAGIAQLVLGILFWTNRAYAYIPHHIANGVVIVIALWTLAVMALIARASRGLAGFALLWGLALPAFGMRQGMILIGPLHWIIELTHLLMGLVALGVAQRLAHAILVAAPRRVGASNVERAGMAAERAT